MFQMEHAIGIQKLTVCIALIAILIWLGGFAPNVVLDTMQLVQYFIHHRIASHVNVLMVLHRDVSQTLDNAVNAHQEHMV